MCDWMYDDLPCPPWFLSLIYVRMAMLDHLTHYQADVTTLTLEFLIHFRAQFSDLVRVMGNDASWLVLEASFRLHRLVEVPNA